MAKSNLWKTGIDISAKDKKSLFKTEILEGLNWLANAYDDINKGWGYLPEIPISLKNTAQVIYTYIKCYNELNDEQVNILKESVYAWIMDIQVVGKYTNDYISITRTLIEIRNHIHIFNEDLKNKINDAIVDCLGYFFKVQNEDGGWSDVKGDVSTIIRTAQVLQVISSLKFEATEYQTNAIEKAISWVLSQQNSDGGYGNINKNVITNDYVKRINLSHKQLELQYASNPSATAYVMLALRKCKPHAYKVELSKAAEYLLKTQNADGGWEMFSEFMLRDGSKTSFKHLSTTLAIEALLITYSIDYSSETLINAIDYLISLQDPVYKGWRSSPASESYIWTTCYVLSLFSQIKDHFENIKASEFMAIIKEWWTLKNDKEINVFKLGNTTFSFNTFFGLHYCILFTLLILTWITCAMVITDVNMKLGSLDISQIIKPLAVTVLTVLLGIPWSIFVKVTYQEMNDSWFNSIGWVYGIITGILLAFYGFFF